MIVATRYDEDDDNDDLDLNTTKCYRCFLASEMLDFEHESKFHKNMFSTLKMQSRVIAKRLSLGHIFRLRTLYDDFFYLERDDVEQTEYL